MRIISGKSKGKRIETTHGPGTRPVTDRIKGAVFNILGKVLKGADVLDLFAGSGAMGLEALSRGAKSAVFIEKDQGCVGMIRKNLQNTGVIHSEVYRKDVMIGLKLIPAKKKFSIVFVDPPFNSGLVEKALLLLGDGDILRKNALVICRAHHKDLMPDRSGRLLLFRTERYGENLVGFYRVQSV